MTTDNTNLIRVNKLTVKATDDGHLQADFFRTHKHIATIMDNETGYVADTKLTKSAIREGFRAYVADNSAAFGILFDPADRRTEDNLRKATYATEADVATDATLMVTSDITTFVTKMPHADLVKGWVVSIESMRPKAQTSKGTNLAMLGIKDGKYVSNGNLAWFDIDGVVTITLTNGTEIYQPIAMELVSGQLKKFRMTQTQWNTDTTKSLIEAGVVTEEAKAEKSAKAKTSEMDAGQDKWDSMLDAAKKEDKPTKSKTRKGSKSSKASKAE